MKRQILYKLYSIGIHIYGFIIQFLSFFNSKAKKWRYGRKDWEQQLAQAIDSKRPLAWVHCASLGEFEQGRNLIDQLKAQFPALFIFVSFFSPSGYEVRKNYSQADYVNYLPLDTINNANLLLDILNPTFVCFVRYDLWLNLLREIRNRQIPSILISARLHSSSFFIHSPMSELYKEAFEGFSAIFTQNNVSAVLLREKCYKVEIIESSDTRYDRVHSNKLQFEALPNIEQFKRDRMCLIAGSTWPIGEKLLFQAYESLHKEEDYCMIIAPHEIHTHKIQAWIDKYETESITYSNIAQLKPHHRILWIDNIGMLSKLYFYANIAYVGGAWRTGLHNILEPTVFGIPVIFGPNYQKYPEALDLLEAGGAFSVSNLNMLIETIQSLLSNSELRHAIQKTNTTFIEDRVGATDQIIQWCSEHQIFPQKLT